jgi:pyruvate/2-oxoglutarate/acetoin dehydrogenase E1 component
MKYIESLRNGLEQCINKHDALLFGEDIGEPYGGAFKVTKGLSDKYPQNIVMTPMCEQGFTGAGIGNALSGAYVIVEIMFGDFITLCSDQLINHAAKFYDIYGMDLHFVIRTPSGGYRGYGATHSQSLERIFAGIPGINVIAPSVFHNPGDLLVNAIENGKPTIFIEHKLDYNKVLIDKNNIVNYFEITMINGVVDINIDGEKPVLTIVTYGGLASIIYEIAQKLMIDEEIPIQILIISDLNIQAEKITNFIKNDKMMFLEEGWVNHGIGAEFTSICSTYDLKSKRIGAFPYSIFSGRKLENSILPVEINIINTIKEFIV